MNVDRFRVIVIGRILLLTASAFLFLYLLMNSTLLMLTILVGIMIIYQIYGLIHWVEKTNRELQRFFRSIGKGISASFYMTLTKGFIQSNIDENISPKDVLIKAQEDDMTIIGIKAPPGK